MKLPLLLVLFTLLSAATPPEGYANLVSVMAGQQEQSPKGQPKPSTQKKSTALTGCMDEQEGHYVLVDDRNLTAIASLEADGFPTEAFAKYMGHKVTVRGIASTDSSRPVFKVRTVETVSETCAPKAAQQEKQ